MTLSAPVTAQAEIAEVIWVDPATVPQEQLAPLTRDTLMPLARNILHSATPSAEWLNSLLIYNVPGRGLFCF